MKSIFFAEEKTANFKYAAGKLAQFLGFKEVVEVGSVPRVVCAEDPTLFQHAESPSYEGMTLLTNARSSFESWGCNVNAFITRHVEETLHLGWGHAETICVDSSTYMVLFKKVADRLIPMKVVYGVNAHEACFCALAEAWERETGEQVLVSFLNQHPEHKMQCWFDNHNSLPCAKTARNYYGPVDFWGLQKPKAANAAEG